MSERTELETQLIEALMDADSDIFYWIQLAEKQMQELPNWEHLPCAPTTHGVAASVAVRGKISAVMRAYHEHEKKFH